MGDAQGNGRSTSLLCPPCMTYYDANGGSDDGTLRHPGEGNGPGRDYYLTPYYQNQGTSGAGAID